MFTKILLLGKSCEREPENIRNIYAVAVIKDTMIIGHLPRNISYVHFSGGEKAAVRYSADPPQAALEISCILRYNKRFLKN